MTRDFWQCCPVCKHCCLLMRLCISFYISFRKFVKGFWKGSIFLKKAALVSSFTEAVHADMFSICWCFGWEPRSQRVILFFHLGWHSPMFHSESLYAEGVSCVYAPNHTASRHGDTAFCCCCLCTPLEVTLCSLFCPCSNCGGVKPKSKLSEKS